jgi:hypothetical protein
MLVTASIRLPVPPAECVRKKIAVRDHVPDGDSSAAAKLR